MTNHTTLCKCQLVSTHLDLSCHNRKWISSHADVCRKWLTLLCTYLYYKPPSLYLEFKGKFLLVSFEPTFSTSKDCCASVSSSVIVQCPWYFLCLSSSALEKRSQTSRTRTHKKIQTQSVKLPLQTTKEQTQRQAPKATLNPVSLPLQYPSSLHREPCSAQLHHVMLQCLE